jgi:hypothetical protein
MSLFAASPIIVQVLSSFTKIFCFESLIAKVEQTNYIGQRGKQVSEKKASYSEYFDHNGVIVGVLSLFCGFLFTSITILLTSLQNKESVPAQAAILFLTLIFYFSLYVLLDNLEMAFHYIEDIPPMTLKVRPFLNLLLIFYLFGTSTILMFLLFNLLFLTVISAVIWVLVVIASISSTVNRFYKQSVKRSWQPPSS